MNSLVLDVKDEKIRKSWLQITFFFYFIYPTCLIAFMILLHLETPLTPLDIYKMMMYASMFNLLPFGAMLFFAHHKHGTRLLTFALVAGPLIYIFSTLYTLKKPCDGLTYTTIILDTALYAWWYWASMRLRKLNQKIRAERLSIQNSLQVD